MVFPVRKGISNVKATFYQTIAIMNSKHFI